MPERSFTVDQLKETLTGGLIPAAPVMFDLEHRFNEGAHTGYVDYMRSQPIAGVAVWAHTGRGLHLSSDVSQRVLKVWREALTEKPLIAGVGANDSNPLNATDATRAMILRAAEHGADAVLVYPPSFLKEHERRDALIVEYHARIAGLGLPLVLFYLYEAAGGISYSNEVLDELLSIPNVIGIKMATLDSVMTYQDVARHIQSHHADKLLITGEDRFLGYSLQRGARAALIGMGAVCCELQAELIKSHFEGKAQRFLELSDLVDKLAEVLFVQPMEGYIGRILFALSRLGIVPEDATHDPWGPPLTTNDLENIDALLNTLPAELCTRS